MGKEPIRLQDSLLCPLKKKVKADKALKLNEIQAREIENTFKQERNLNTTQRQTGPFAVSPKKTLVKVGDCGGPYLYKDLYPTKNKKCNSCGKLNHCARVCRTNPLESAKHVMHEDTEDENYFYTIGRDKQPTCKVTIDEQQVEMMIKTGASVDLMKESTLGSYTKGRYQKPPSAEFAPRIIDTSTCAEKH